MTRSDHRRTRRGWKDVKTGSNLVVIGGVIVVAIAIAGVAQPTAVAASNSGMGFDPAIHLSAPSSE